MQIWGIIDLDLIKKILITDFEHFSSRGLYYNEKSDPLSANIFFVDGEVWRKLRKKSSPALTTSKIKYMFDVVLKCAEQFKEEIAKLSEKNEPFDAKEVCAMLFTDMICKRKKKINLNLKKFIRNVRLLLSCYFRQHSIWG